MPRPSPLISLAALALTVVGGSPLRAQAPQASQAPPTSATPQAPGADVAGAWSGRAVLTNDWPGLSCRYEGKDDPPTVRLELARDGAAWTGSIAIDAVPAAASPCPPLRKRSAIPGGVNVSGDAMSFTDASGHEWNLALRRTDGILRGIVAWRTGDEPLAEGFKTKDGAVPLTRLSGEVTLRRTTIGPAASGPAPASAEGAPKPKVTAGKRAGHVAAIVGANLVAVGALVAVNKLGKGDGDQTGPVTCSPRTCIIVAVGEPCMCNVIVPSGAPCGTTTTGVPLFGACDGMARPCEADLSCNQGRCEDRTGACPY